MDILTRAFYSRDTLTVARDLLGRDIVRAREDGKRLVCRITETEAYIGRLDKAAVLIRGAVPVTNGDIIAENRFACKEKDMTAYQRKNFLNGPGKLCRGLDLTRAQNGLDLTGPAGGLYLLPGAPPAPAAVRTGKRIGIDYAEEAVDFPWRFYL